MKDAVKIKLFNFVKLNVKMILVVVGKESINSEENYSAFQGGEKYTTLCH